MQIAVISDVHGNLEGLRAVLHDIAAQGITTICSLGDIVGYGPDVNECCALVRECCAVSLLGNHDDALLGRTSIHRFNAHACAALEYARSVLQPEHVAYLAALPYRHVTDEIYLAHSTPRHERAWEYLGADNLQGNLAVVADRIGCVGHSHLHGAYVWSEDSGGWSYLPALSRLDQEIPLGERGAIVVAGSVGQPRDNDPRASYVLLDPQHRRLRFRRVSYPIDKVQRRILQAGLPKSLAIRLAQGY